VNPQPELLPAATRILPTLAGEFSTIVADPPWPIRMGGSKDGAPLNGFSTVDALPYPTLSLEELGAIELPAAENAHLYLWTINRFIVAAYTLANHWRFRPSTMLVWIKSPMGLGLGGPFATNTEFCLFCRRGNLPTKRRIDRTWFSWPRGRHSEKPEAFQSMVESISPGPYLEIFARRPRHGWSTYGNELKPLETRTDE